MSRRVVGMRRGARRNALGNSMGKCELHRPDTSRTAVKRSAAFLALLLLAACDSADSTDATDVLLRVENETAVDFSSVSVGFTGEATTYGAVRAGRTSEYRAFETAYRYGGIGVRTADGGAYSLVPYDFVGEEPLAPGRYTYRLDIEENGLIRLEFEQD